nr:perlucin-like [Bactrocera oleae]
MPGNNFKRIFISCLLYRYAFAQNTDIFVHRTHYDEFIIFNKNAETWKDALDRCHEHTANLVSLESQKKLIGLHMFLFSNDFIQTTVNKADRTFIYWSGGNDLSNPGTYEWEGTGKAFKYTHWLNDQPVNIESGGCIQFGAGGFGRWSTENCDTKRFFVCERNKN